MIYDVIVIGAGAAGSYSAYLLNNLGYSVKILEARDRVGGRTYSLEDVDIGGSWVSTQQPIIYNLCKNLGLTLIPQYEDGKVVINNQNNERIIDNQFISYKSHAAYSHMLEFEKWGKKIDLSDKFYQDLDCVSVEDWAHIHLKDVVAKDFITNFVSGICTSPKNKISMLFWLTFLNQCRGFDCLYGSVNAAQEFRVKEGTQIISKKLTANLDLEFNQIVKQVKKLEDESYCVTTQNNSKFYAKKVICAIPPNHINKIHWLPALEEGRVKLYQGMKMGSVTKMVIKYKKAFWRDAGYSGLCLSDSLPRIVTFDGCTKDYNALIVFVTHINGDGFVYYNDADIINKLAALFAIEELAVPLKVYRKDWPLDEFATGCYFCVPEIGHGHLYNYLAKPNDSIYFIGTETASTWYGYIEGALESAERVVKQIQSC